MGRKGKRPKLLMCLMAASTVVTGILGSVPLPVKATEEENYTVTFEAYEGNCDTESISVPRGESIILPEASYEGHYLESWMDTVKEEDVVEYTAIGRPGDTYTPERDLWLYANWKPEQVQDITAIYEAKIGDTGYETLEEAVANVQAGDVITVLRDCSVSKVLEITADDVTLRSDNADNPVTIRREEGFKGKWYIMNTDTALLAVKRGSLTTQDVIFDGGAVLDDDFNNSGEAWNSPLIYVAGSYAMEKGTVLQNNCNSMDSDERSRTSGALYIGQGGSFTMDGALIQNCCTTGSGGGIQSESGVHVSAASSTIRNCYARSYGGGMDLHGEAELSGMTFSGNKAGSTGGAVSASAPITVTDSLIEGNESVYDGGGICTATGHLAHITGCTFTGNTAPRGSAIQTMKGEGTLPLVIRDCTFTGNPSAGFSHAGGVICYGNETGIILSGHIVMEDNLTAGTEPCDINYFYNTGASILLDDDFESDSTFVLGGFDSIKPGRVLIDGTLYHKNASTEQFIWHNQTYCTEKRGDTYNAPKEDTTYYAAWEKAEATVTFDADGGKMEGGDITAKVDDTITLPACTKDGYEFAGWYDNDTCVGNAGDGYTVTDDVVLKAHYIKKEAPTCIVTFDTDGGKEISPVKVEKGRAIHLPEAEKENHIFLGWYTEKEDGEKIDAEFTVTEDITLYARWEKEAEKPEERPEATITFDADGGKMEGGDITAKVGDTITLPACTKDGYEFAGWYDNDTCVGNAGEEYTVTEDVVLKAHYEKKAETTYLITFDPNGGRKAEHIRAAKGEKITLPGTEKSGYVFLGWYTEKEGGILLGIAGDELEVTKDMTVYALWEKENAGQTGDKEPETCKAVFHTEGGTLKNTTLTVIKGAGLYLPLPEKEGFEFSGWYLDKSLTQFAGTYRDVYRITKDMDFYAKWEKVEEDNSDTDDSKDDDTEQDGNAKTYTIKYDANGGTVKESSVKVEKGKTVKLPSAEREGFSFKGWYTDQHQYGRMPYAGL